MMTREDKLYSMKGSDLIKEADKLGVKAKCNKTRTQLTEAKSNVVERILAAEAEIAAHIEEETDAIIEEQEIEEQEEKAAEEETKQQVQETEEKIEEEIEPFVYTDAFGTEWEDEEIGKMISKWSEEKRAEFRKWFDAYVSDVEVDLDALDYVIAKWCENWDAEHDAEPKEKREGHKPTAKRGALIEFEGKSQNICAWGKELGISPNTLYGRLYKMNWSVEKAFTTPGKKRK